LPASSHERFDAAHERAPGPFSRPQCKGAGLIFLLRSSAGSCSLDFLAAAQAARPGTQFSFCRASSRSAEDFRLPPVFSVVAFDLCSSVLLQLGFASASFILECRFQA
jgi:hypothetical protein